MIDLPRIAGTLRHWTKDHALRLRIHDAPSRLDFDVTRRRYARMYHALGIPELGQVLSCQRGATLRADVALERRQTIHAGRRLL